MNCRFALFILLMVSLCALVCAVPALAQSTGTLRGQVTDPSGAVVISATVTVTSADGQTASTTSNKSGVYEIKNLAPGKYKLSAVAPGFSAFELTDVNVPAAVQQLDIALDIAVKKEQVIVQDETNNVDVNPSSNANATVLKDKDLDALSDDPDELASDLQALAGPSAGPNGGQIYIDGFTDGTLPPKASIREIRINQNPFSAQYDRLGYGRIEVFTKPGSDKWHGQVTVEANPKALNAANPYAADPNAIPDYLTTQYAVNVSGALSSKASLFFNIERRNIEDNAVINATVPTGSDLIGNTVVPTPRYRTNLSPRFDYQITPNNTLTARYQFLQNSEENNGIGQLTLKDQAYNSNGDEHQIQISDTQVLSPSVINETRFQFIRNHTDRSAINTSPSVSVAGYFNTGGNSLVHYADLNNSYELQNYTSMQRGKHFIKFGGRLRGNNESNLSLANSNGAFIYDGSISGDALTDFQNGTPSHFAYTVGEPIAHLTYADLGLYAEDDWKLRPNLTVSYGLRYETQSGIADHHDFAPRVGLSWGLGSAKSSPKTVLRLGWGMFYDRFSQSNLMVLERFNGVTQQQYMLAYPTFNERTFDPATDIPNPLPASKVAQQTAASNLRTPYTMQLAATLERQIGKVGTVSATYLNSRGVHTLVARNVNAPYLSGYDPNYGDITEFESVGTYKQNQFIVNSNVRVSTRVSLNSFYMLGYANATAYNPSDAANINADFGRAAYDIRQRFFLGGSISLPYLVRFSPFIVANAGVPYNVTLGSDPNHDNVFNDRPTYAQLSQALQTQFPGVGNICGANTAANPNQLVPVNCGTGPANFSFNMRFSKTFGIGHKLSRESKGDASAQQQGGHGPGGGRGPGGAFGPRGMGGMFATSSSDRRYNLTLIANVRNLFNSANPAAPIGVLTSPDFGRSIALAGGPFSSGSAYNRRIELELRFDF